MIFGLVDGIADVAHPAKRGPLVAVLQVLVKMMRDDGAGLKTQVGEGHRHTFLSQALQAGAHRKKKYFLGAVVNQGLFDEIGQG